MVNERFVEELAEKLIRRISPELRDTDPDCENDEGCHRCCYGSEFDATLEDDGYVCHSCESAWYDDGSGSEVEVLNSYFDHEGETVYTVRRREPDEKQLDFLMERISQAIHEAIEFGAEQLTSDKWGD